LAAEIADKEASIEKEKADLIHKEKTLSTRQKSINDHVANSRQHESEKQINNERLRFLNDRASSLRDQIEQTARAMSGPILRSRAFRPRSSPPSRCWTRSRGRPRRSKLNTNLKKRRLPSSRWMSTPCVIIKGTSRKNISRPTRQLRYARYRSPR